MARGDGTHKPPVKADIGRAVGKEAGPTARVRLTERLDGWCPGLSDPSPGRSGAGVAAPPRGRVRPR
jgi:hypothetical protein